MEYLTYTNLHRGGGFSMFTKASNVICLYTNDFMLYFLYVQRDRKNKASSKNFNYFKQFENTKVFFFINFAGTIYNGISHNCVLKTW